MLAAVVIIIQEQAKAAIVVAPATKEWSDIKVLPMNNSRDILILMKDQKMDQKAIDREIENLNAILLSTETSGQFCTAHELVNRNRITSNPGKILNAISLPELKPFRFLICKN